MRKKLFQSAAIMATLLLCYPALAMEMPPMGEEEKAAAAADYQKYCSLCHGADREGNRLHAAPARHHPVPLRLVGGRCRRARISGIGLALGACAVELKSLPVRYRIRKAV